MITSRFVKNTTFLNNSCTNKPYVTLNINMLIFMRLLPIVKFPPVYPLKLQFDTGVLEQVGPGDTCPTTFCWDDNIVPQNLFRKAQMKCCITILCLPTPLKYILDRFCVKAVYWCKCIVKFENIYKLLVENNFSINRQGLTKL